MGIKPALLKMSVSVDNTFGDKILKNNKYIQLQHAPMTCKRKATQVDYKRL